MQPKPLKHTARRLRKLVPGKTTFVRVMDPGHIQIVRSRLSVAASKEASGNSKVFRVREVPGGVRVWRLS